MNSGVVKKLCDWNKATTPKKENNNNKNQYSQYSVTYS